MIYAMSDLHGQYDLYKKMLKKIKFSDSDTLYILGDVIDRGPKPIELLFDMMKHSNIKPLLGNHDHRMLSVLIHGDISSVEEAQLRAKDDPMLADWIYDGGINTIKEYCNLSKDDKDKILKYLNTFQLIVTFDINDKKFFLSHTAPEKDDILDLSKTDLNDFIWGEVEYDKRYFKNGYLVTGHTPTHLIDRSYRGRIYQNNGHIAIDCGAFFTDTLGCVCLDTLGEFYVGKWDNCSLKHIIKEIAGVDVVDNSKPLYEILAIDSARFSKVPFANLDLSNRTYVCLSHYLNHPFASCEPGFVPRKMISDLLEMSPDNYYHVLNFSPACFAEMLEKLVYVSKGIRR